MENNEKNKSKVLPVVLNVLFTIIATAIIFIVVNLLK